MGISIGELFMDLGFEVDDAKLKDFNSAINSTLNDMLKLAGITASVAGFVHLMNGATEAAVRLRNMNAEIGASSREVQKWASVVNQVNPAINVDAATESYRRFGDLIKAQITQGKGPSGALARLLGSHWHSGMTEEEAIDSIAANKSNFLTQNGGGASAKAIFSDLLDAVGLGAGSTRAFDLTRSQRDAMSDRMVVEQANLEKLDVLADKMAVLGQLWDRLIKNQMANVAGHIVDLVDSLQNGPHGHAAGTDSTAYKIANWIGKYYHPVDGYIDGVNAISQGGDAVFSSVYSTGKELADRIKSSEAAGYAQSFFKSAGRTQEQAAGMVMGLMRESGLDPSAVGDNGKAYGIGQWHPDRQADFKAWAGKDIHGSSLAEQLAFVQYELTQGKEWRANALLEKSKDSVQGSYANFENGYERPAKRVQMTQNNSISIHSNADPKRIAEEVNAKIQQQYNAAYTATNLGPVY